MNKNTREIINMDYVLKNYFYIIILILIPLLFLIGFFYMIEPSYQSMKIENLTALDLESKYRNLKYTQISRLKEYQDNFEKIGSDKINKIQNTIPDYKDISNIIYQLDSITKKSSVDISEILFTEDDISENEDLKDFKIDDLNIIKFSLRIENGKSYETFKNFLNELENNSRLFKVINLYVSSDFKTYNLDIICYYKA